MPTFFARKLLPPAAGILLAATTVISGPQAALAAKVSAVSTAASPQGSEHLLLAQTGQSPQATILPIPNRGTVNRAAGPVKIPEPSMLAGLGLVAGSLVMTRRRARVKQESFGKNQSF
ncbi:MAG: PEP-CTERM sorting domain-containing protein [Microcoleus sp. PH2017_10_PVI_O_A]|uniref:PEP-CTERM sorting domain-containing protein n=1 Tax=unclassified Microcoleus TaxID=2642155 RepID=UPI001E000484|nr:MULTISPECIES: PEP-CTERM sorting domain-containing protein [unclassified Microcoleus]TAE75494.1 MAG: PEP-CTERM sorting domain-containing protein [Oscillatoriales cyanobacterium]MCC3409484.1 PEP-CTERM sorting domain-containing protein [Microcoleus sp. PH2017_10_PVI_O_A]MCC3463733.1 PEP-CTERM sorting domain-containing protein [Microcoleus sp. PH2017_11_PCY_U_A]MCC3482093.1 PEP-CTERM sorting domain-containing protein [Microcoleus sp. PH2017_12_PCY_D_A]MCC3530932.1 PEP-CTERM sorting domain-conta